MAVPKDNITANGRHRKSRAGMKSMKCPLCGFNFIRKTDGKCKLRTRVLIFNRNGNTMGICPKCKTGLKVPISLSNAQARTLALGERKRDGGTG